MSGELPPDGTGESREQAHIEKIPVEQAVKDAALEKIRGTVKGNGFDPQHLTMKSFEGELLRFEAETILHIRSRVTEKIVAGRMSGPKACDSLAALKQAMDNEYQNFVQGRDMIRKVREVVLNRNDKGFALNDIIIPLNFWRKDFVRYEPCGHCRSAGKIQCSQCHGQGWENCPQCHRKGRIACATCGGDGKMPGAKGQERCPRCNGQGFLVCTRCQQKGEVQCAKCKGQGAMTCPQCQGHAWNSRLSILELDICTEFTYDRDVVPEKVAALMERVGPKLDKHAVIEVSQKQEHLDEDLAQQKIAIHYNVALPYGHIEFELEQERFYAFLFGHTAQLTYVSDFLDTLIANGARKLKDAGDARGDVAANLQAAAKYKTVKQAIIAAARYPAGKAMKALQKANPMGLSEAMIKTLIHDAGRALKNITRKPQMLGLAGGLFLSAAFYAAWFLVPLRIHATEMIANAQLHIALDFLAAGLGACMTVMAVQISGLNAIRKALKGIVPKGKESNFMPRLGRMGLYAALGALIVFMILLEVSFHHAAAPGWYAGLR